MKIKTKIKIIIIVSVLAVAVISGLLYDAAQRVDKESVEAAKADELAKELSVFNVLVFEYVMHHEERPQKQASFRFDLIAKLLKKDKFEHPEEQAVLEKIRKNYEHVGADFFRIIDIRERSGLSQRESVLSSGLEERLESSILFKSQQMIFDAFNLARMLREKEEIYHGRIHALIFISLAIIFAGVVAISIMITGSVTKPLTRLHKGTEIVGSGNLNYKTAIESKDEIGQLSRAFDSMTENLKLVTASRDELNREIEERKRTEEKLNQYSEALERSNKELEQFAYIASHDLQEPLHKIMAFGERLKARAYGSLNEQNRDYVDRMQNAAMRMRQLIDDLLLYSRVSTRGREFELVALSSALSDALSVLDHRIEETKGEVSAGPLPSVMADRVQMSQLFQNLIGNALKFRKSDVPPLVRVSGRTLENSFAEIKIEDNGIGFDEKYLDRIFILFQRLHGRDEYEGTGIGLALCRKIVERHKGTLTARSRPGQGATFIVTLPAGSNEIRKET